MGHVVFIGPPGSGKGTQARLLAARSGWLHVSTGELLRDLIGCDTALSRWIAARLDYGNFAPDHMVLQLISEFLDSQATDTGCLFDGFPRTLPQAQMLDRMLAGSANEVVAAIQLDAPAQVLFSRLAERGRQEGRVDDHPEAVAQRMEVFARVTEPVIEYYRETGRLVRIDADGSPEVVAERLNAVLDSAMA